MPKTWEMEPESFEKLLAWLDEDREAAANQYEAIRRSLNAIFRTRGFSDPEELADETINRVARKIPQIAPSYSGEPIRYFYGVAKHVLLEYQRERSRLRLSPAEDAEQVPTDLRVEREGIERQRDLECLEECLNQLPGDTRGLITEYYSPSPGADEFDSRKELAKKN